MLGMYVREVHTKQISINVESFFVTLPFLTNTSRCSVTMQQSHLVLCVIKVYSDLKTSFSDLCSLHRPNRMPEPLRRL